MDRLCRARGGGKAPYRSTNQWGADDRVLKGKKVGDGTIELIPGS